MANVITTTITNSWDCPIILDKDFGSYSSVSWQNGLYVDNDDYTPDTSGSEIYGLAVPGTNFDEAWCCTATSSNYDTAPSYWQNNLDQSGTIAGTDSISGRTIGPGETVTIHWFGLGGGWTAPQGNFYYMAISVFSTQIRWEGTITSFNSTLVL